MDVAKVGGKNASSKGIAVPPGFTTTADAYYRFVDANGLRESIRAQMKRPRNRTKP